MCDIIRTTPGLLVPGTAAQQLQARVALLRRAFPEESWPDLSTGLLFSRPEEWLPIWLSGIRTIQQLQALDLLLPLRSLLTREQGRLLEERTPVAITVPSGSRVAINYTAGPQPVLAVKLQEMFGLADTPTIAGGRVKLLLHLLSPARRPVQITQDLKAFWNTGYPLVKKELKGRYPKHPWPDDPWNATPTCRSKPRGQ
jgi:ATP-dependent helicase HrpB